MTDQEDKKLSFLPFHAINHFMRDDFRREVIRATVFGMPGLPGGLRSAVDRQVRQHVTVPGFRNSVKAPAALKARHMPDAFEKDPDLAAAVLAAWAAIKSELSGQVYDLLTLRGWELLPADADRTKLPGFLTSWPKGEDFDGINAAYAEKYPASETSADEVSLMVVWLSGRLPVDES